MKATIVFVLSALTALTQAHGTIRTPVVRQPGKAFAKACTDAVYNTAVKEDLQRAGPIEVWEIVGSGQNGWNAGACNIYQCKGLKLEDNLDSVQMYEPGQVVEMRAEVLAHHPDGWANVSVIDLKSNKIIGQPLKLWDEYDLPQEPVPEDNYKWTVKIPDLKNVCKQPGDCAIQWYWYSAFSVQTYEECVDFVIA